MDFLVDNFSQKVVKKKEQAAEVVEREKFFPDEIRMNLGMTFM